MNVQRYARVAGLLFLISMVAGGIGEAYVPAKIIVSGDPAATVANIASHNLLYRIGFATFLIESFCDVTLALIMYALLKPVNRQLSLLAAFFGLMATATFAFAELFYFAPTIMSAPYLKTFSPEQLNALVLLSLKFYGYAGMIFTGYYGIAWLMRSYLIWKSTFLPKFLGVLMGLGGLGFLLRNIAMILAPQYAYDIFLMLMFPGGLAMTIWFLVKGVDGPKWNASAGVTTSQIQGAGNLLT